VTPSRPQRRRELPLEARIAIVFGGSIALAVAIMALSGLFTAAPAGTQASANTVQQALPQADGRPDPNRHPIAVVTRPTVLRASPGGRRLARLKTKTEFKSAKVVPVVAERDGWLRVIAPELDNGKRGWIEAKNTQQGVVDYRMRVDVSKRRLEVLRGGRVVRRIRTAVGEAGTPTPHGTFGITDKVPFTDPGSVYGCCALALSAHQNSVPPGWTGGDRIAIHATPARSSIGQPVTAGCMRVPTADARWLMSRIPLGTIVTVRA
jgi:lipoprotein-anchoring transpeptidase ErfK/SrfK